jgi:hypothetical protein
MRPENTFGIRPTEPVPGIAPSRIQRELREEAGPRIVTFSPAWFGVSGLEFGAAIELDAKL